MQHAQKVTSDIKAHIKHLRLTTARLAQNVATQRELSAMLIVQLAKGITVVKTTPMRLQAEQDPVLLKLATERQLKRQVHAENQLHKSLGECDMLSTQSQPIRDSLALGMYLAFSPDTIRLRHQRRVHRPTSSSHLVPLPRAPQQHLYYHPVEVDSSGGPIIRIESDKGMDPLCS